MGWMKSAVKPSRKGVFKAKAKKAGMSTSTFAAKESSAPGTLGKEARLAQTFSKFRPKAKRGTLMKGRMNQMRSSGAFGK